jgi:1,4-dihydroxy-2-naphthoyl-CoA hydrolase
MSFDALYGLELTDCSDSSVQGRVLVREELKRSAGLVHGGVYSAVSEAAAVRGTEAAIGGDGQVAVGLSNLTTQLHPIADGTIHVRAVCRHRGRTTWVWEVELTDDNGKLCVLARVTIAVRER